MATDNLQDGSEVAPEEFQDLQKRFTKLEKKLARAKSTAQETTREIWQLDVRLKEQEDRARAAEERAESAEERAESAEERAERAEERAERAEEELRSAGPQVQTDVVDAELGALRLDALRIELHEAEERARLAEEKLSTVTGSTSAVEGQLQEIQEKMRQAEERALEWEERFHRSEEKLSESQADQEPPAGVAIEEYQRLERELEEFKAELEEANQRTELTEERGHLLQDKVDQAEEDLAELRAALEELRADRERLASELEQAKSQPQPVAAVAGLSLAGDPAGEASQIGEAMRRVREAELKSNQAEIKLQKAQETLKEYERRANESDRETQRLAFQDCLTGLPNLNLIRQYLEFTVKQVQRFNRASALLVVDLDRFKLINDAMGFKVGDELLIKVGERLQSAIRESDALGRKGEDEFLILLSELITGDDDAPPEQKTNMIRQNIAIVVNRISECLSRPFVIQGQKFYIRASIGVSICPNDASSAQDMLEHADTAVYHAKESGRGRCVFYNNELHKLQERRLAMDSELRLAMEKGEFTLQYQPIIEVIKGSGRIVGVEALLRWNHRLEGLLEPEAFLKVAEETGLIVQLGQWVCRQSCWQLKQWLSQGHQLFMSFNVSTRQMLQADLAEMIVSSVREFGLQPGLVYVELAEGLNVEEVDLCERVITNLGRSGIRVAIDDFGVGYSSLSKFDLQHVQFLKIDPSLIEGCPQDQSKTSICEAAVRLGDSLGLIPLGEGVENAAQAKFLVKSGCRMMQGFHFSRPLDPEQLSALLTEKRVWRL